MAILKLHENNNPQSLALVNTDDISTVTEFASGHSCIITKSGVPNYIQESVEEIYDMLNKENS